jgi:hypothetical protein
MGVDPQVAGGRHIEHGAGRACEGSGGEAAQTDIEGQEILMAMPYL